MKTLINPTKEESTQDFTDKAWEDLINAIHPSDISIQIENGSVYLQGSVASYSRKMLAEQIVSGITGVRSIVNNLEVRNVSRKNDAALLDSVLAALNDEFLVKTPSSPTNEKSLVNAIHHPAVVTTKEFQYWELFC